MANRLLTATEVARRMGISRTKFWSLPEEEKPPVTLIGDIRRYNEQSFERWLLEKEKR